MCLVAQVNQAVVVDAAMAIIEQIAHRPGMLVNDKWDEKDEYSTWNELVPLEMRHVVIDPYGVRNVVTEGHHSCTLHLEVDAQRSKGNYMEQVEYKTSMTPNAVKMVRNGCVRMLRLHARTCAFRAIYSKCTLEQRAALMREVQGPGFKGLPATKHELKAKTGF